MIEFTVESFKRRLSRHQDRPGSAGKINTAACFPSSAMPISTRRRITNRLHSRGRYYSSQDTTVLKTTKDPEDLPDGLDLADIDHFAHAVELRTARYFVNRTSTDRRRPRTFLVTILLLPGIKAARASYQL